MAAADPRVKAVVAIAPPSDLAVWVRGLEGFAPTACVRLMGGAPDETPEQYEQIRVLSFA
jgi:hypothetical protein